MSMEVLATIQVLLVEQPGSVSMTKGVLNDEYFEALTYMPRDAAGCWMTRPSRHLLSFTSNGFVSLQCTFVITTAASVFASQSTESASDWPLQALGGQ